MNMMDSELSAKAIETVSEPGSDPGDEQNR